MADGIAITRNGHRTWLKWHRGRKRIADLPFTAERIIEGMRLGASVEVDLVKHADGGFAVLHDFVLDHDTTGHGLVRETKAAEIRKLFLRGPDGEATAHRPMLFEDLCALLASGEGISPDAILQLDLKEDDPAVFGPHDIATFVATVTPVARHFIISGGSAAAVGRLADEVPSLQVGYDPCHDGAIERLLQTRDFSAFVADALAASPRARMIYLEYRLVLFATEHGFDLVGAFHQGGKTIDAYTLNAASAETAALAERLLTLKVDQITTDDPEALENLLAG